jgi:hypothetical protein
MKKGEPPTLLPLIINKKATENTNAKAKILHGYLLH